MNIAIDIDGVVADFHKGFRNWLIKEGIVEEDRIPVVPPHWSYIDMGVFDTEETFLKFYNEAAGSGVLRELDVLPGAVEAVKVLANSADVFFLTARAEPEDTFEWLEVNGFPRIPVEFLSGKKDHSRARELVFVDDSPKELAGFKQDGLDYVVVDHLYNRGLSGLRVQSLREVPRLLGSLGLESF